MLDQDKILYFLKVTGPTTPGKVAKNLKTEILLASAHLSDLAAQKKVKISYIKIGGTPLYYLPGHEEQLYNFAAGNMNPKDLEVLDELKNKKILREAELDLLHKVSLRSLRDFAIPLQVIYHSKTELFWKWYLLSAEEANHIINQHLNPPAEEKVVIPEDKALTPEEVKLPSSELIEEVKEKALEKEVKTEVKLEIKPEEKAKAPIEKKKSEIKEKKVRSKTIPTDDLLPVIESYFQDLEVDIEQKETVRRKAEFNFLVKVPSVVGKTTYFCKVKKKRICDEKDLSSAYVESQVKKLPLLFLYTGSLAKKAQELMESNVFENVIVKKLE